MSPPDMVSTYGWLTDRAGLDWTPEVRQVNSDSSQRGERIDVPERVRALQPGVHAEGC